jgi:hypothetical protein
VLFNNGGYYSTSTYKFTAPISGYYQFNWNCYTNDPFGRTFLKKNDTPLIQTSDCIQPISIIVELTAGYTVSLAGSETFPMKWYGALSHNASEVH